MCFRGDPPEELQGPEHHNEVERLHVEGQSNQAQKGEHRDGEVEPEQRSQTNNKSTKTLLIERVCVCVCVEGVRGQGGRPQYSQVPARAEVGHGSQACDLQ